jgi:hypothetical protein
MKLKTLCRAVGAFDAAAWSLVGYGCYNILSNANYNFLFEDHPIGHKIIGAAYWGAAAAFVPIPVLGITDGLVDVVKGTHHYFGCKVWQKLTRNKETKAKIQLELEKQLETIEKSISF